MTATVVTRDDSGSLIASHFPASLSISAEMLSAPETDGFTYDGRWLRLCFANGRAVYERVDTDAWAGLIVFARRYGEPVEMLRDES